MCYCCGEKYHTACIKKKSTNHYLCKACDVSAIDGVEKKISLSVVEKMVKDIGDFESTSEELRLFVGIHLKIVKWRNDLNLFFEGIDTLQFGEGRYLEIGKVKLLKIYLKCCDGLKIDIPEVGALRNLKQYCGPIIMPIKEFVDVKRISIAPSIGDKRKKRVMTELFCKRKLLNY